MNNTVLEFECIGMDGGSKFPIEYTGRGQDISPEFIIKNLSPNAKTLAVTLEDLSHPIKDFTHWVIWNIPATDRIKKNIPVGKTVPMLGNARQGIGYGFHRYVGPKPPKGKKHTYRFTVYLENLQRLLGQPPVPEDGEFSEEDIDKYVFGVRVYEDRFEWLLNLSPEARGELDDAGSPVYFTKLTVTPDDERAWFKMHPQWSKSNKYAELEAWIFI